MKNFIVLLAGFLFLGGIESCKSDTKGITTDSSYINASPQDFEKGLKGAGVQLVDVRTLEEFQEGHLKGAIQADFYEDTQFTKFLGSLNKDKPVYVYCRSGGRSGKTAQTLIEMGFKNVVNLDGGIKAWNSLALPVVKP